MSAAFNYYGNNNVWSYATAFPAAKPKSYAPPVKPTAPAAKPVAQAPSLKRPSKPLPPVQPPSVHARFADANKLPPLPPVNNSCYAPPKVPPGVTRKIQVNLPTEYRQVNLQQPTSLKVIHKEKTNHVTVDQRNVVTREQPRQKTNAVIYPAKNYAQLVKPQARQQQPPKTVKAGPQMAAQLKSADFNKYFSF